jgi:adhesin transport system membrane fusion protein
MSASLPRGAGRAPDFASEVAASLHGDVAPRVRGIAYLLVALVVVFATWASLARIDVTTVGMGKVIPTSQHQVVQSLEGGIVEDILVAEGATVAPGDVLLRLENTGFVSALGELQAKRDALRARLARLEAEVDGRDAFAAEPGPDLAGVAEDTLASERALFAARHAAAAQARAVLEQQALQREQELRDARSHAEETEKVYALARQEVATLKPLAEANLVPRMERLKAERELATLGRELDSAQGAIPRAETALREAEDRLAQQPLDLRAERLGELTAVRAEIAGLDESIRAATDRVARTDVRAPARGIVNRVGVTTRGEVVQPGRTLVEITPIEDTLLVEVRIRPSDVAFLHPGQSANVKLTAYDSSIYGSLPGTIDRIGSDTITDEKGESYYRIIVRTDKAHLEHDGARLPIIPGMTAGVDVLTGERTVMQYLLKPILKATGEAMSER